MKNKSEKNKISRRHFLAGTAVVSSQIIAPNMLQASSGKTPLFSRNKLNIDHFVADCIEANKEAEPQLAIKEVLLEAVAKPKNVLSAFGAPDKAGIEVLLSSKELTIFRANWTPQMNLLPHNHLMWALIGIYTGREDNIMWKRNQEGNITAYGAEALFEGDVGELPSTAIHSVTNPLLRFTGGIHIYGGDFFHTERSQWDPESLAEEPSNGDDIKAMFARENERYSKKIGQ